MAYGIDQPAGGMMKATTLAFQGGTAEGMAPLAGRSRASSMAATLSVPEKLTQPCIVCWGNNPPRQTCGAGDMTPGQRTPHSKGPAST